MAIPLSGSNLVGTLTLASSGSTGSGQVGPTNDLGLAVGTTVTNGNSLQTANVSLPSTPMTCIFLAQMSSGTANLVADTKTDGTTPAFSGGSAVTVQVTHGEPVYVGPIQTAGVTQTNTNGIVTNTLVNNVVALKITNVSGATLTLQALRLISAIVYGNKQDWFTVKTGFVASGAPTPEVSDGTGTFVLNT